ncbi:hypothetical protein K437DRAFT_218841 [Tilletiaria anomala UBC 951]|uniref:Photolyase/cryptochrome alpha/beta domain-containing protein n=1 Tax=Tilletiaria anomala (strain ATCC 24038 / CBS 436.72 / UBC 951) TaxID=1037660 RepID=A0A066WHE3_TILAU|nr:uncharacterized protein K437DRAFT_218841 [Tilletiaria anomala UBC 951]KDN53397.1 hypothetical protein K437DRAFT_218841 [Tilletiaria anomala UBC 951]
MKENKTESKSKSDVDHSSDEEEASYPARKRSKKEDGDAKKSTSSAPAYGKGHPRANELNPRLPKNVTPLEDLRKALSSIRTLEPTWTNGRNVIYWQRNKDLRIADNHALSLASSIAQKNKAHIIALHVLSPSDYAAHDRSPRRVDFILRNLRILQKDFKERFNIPFVVVEHKDRKTLVDRVLQLADEWGATNICGNIEYEVDELWRDAALVRKAEKSKNTIHAAFVDDAYVVPPGKVITKDGRPYSVFSPWNRAWTAYIEKHKDMLEAHPDPEPNDKKAITSDSKLQKLFDSKVPDHVSGFECDADDQKYMAKLWPAGEEAAQKVLQNFFYSKGGISMFEEPATGEPRTMVKEADAKKGEETRLSRYSTGRNLMNENGTSHISPYLAAGIVSARECLRQTKAITKNRLHVGRDSGPAMWNTEISFRDFYAHVLSAWPRVCMGRAYLLKYEDVIWESAEGENLERWKQGKTGYPIVDAAMRQCKKQGYMHNRGRMITAMFLTKHLMIDWREGERWFMQNLIDGDFASNNGGWQWSASTGTDPQPYFRIFNPLSQSEKSDPDGSYIRHWVPELKNVKGNAIHAPYDRMSKAEFDKLGYPKPIVEHTEARQRALRRFKAPGKK